MGTDSFKQIVSVDGGETLKLASVMPGEVVIKVDVGRTAAPCAMGTQTVLPKAAVPVHRHVERDLVVFVHKGQGRVTLGAQTMTVVPGITVAVPRQTWYGIRNTGTGMLQITWTVVPGGIEGFFRELSRFTGSVEFSAVQALAQRYGIEMQTDVPTGQPPASGPKNGRRRRHHRGGRGHQRRQGQPALPAKPRPTSAQASESKPSTPPSLATSASPQPSGPRRERSPEPRSDPRKARTESSAAAPPSTAAGSKPSPRNRSRRPGRHRRVREVYMGGRWIQVSGEGPVIDLGGKERSEQRKHRSGDDDTPSGPLSVPL